MLRIAFGAALLLALVLAPLLEAQSPRFSMTAGVRPATVMILEVEGPPSAVWLGLMDLDGTETWLGSLHLYLGLSPYFGTFGNGVIGPLGQTLATIPIPPISGLHGAVVYGQVLMLAPGSTTPLVTNGASSCFTEIWPALQEKFDDPAAAGFTGSYDASVKDRLQGAPVTAGTSSQALSPFLPAATVQRDYTAPIVAASIPGGTSLAIEYRGSTDRQGSATSAWSSSVDVADGYAFLQYRASFTANSLTGEVPSIDTLVIPMR